MPLNNTALHEACNKAKNAALDAWSAISHFHGGSYDIEHKKDGPSTEADKLADQLIVESLARHYPTSEYGYLSEEFQRDPIRLDRQRVWIIDPIDGTSDFIRGSGDFAIQVGLVEEINGTWQPVVGIVYHPLAGHLFSAIRHGGAFIEVESDAHTPVNSRWWFRRPEEPPRLAGTATFQKPRRLAVRQRHQVQDMVAVVSASHRTKRLLRVLDSVPFHSHYSRGSVGIKIGEIALGNADVYVNTERSRCKEWDLCGPHLILTESGGTVTDLDGDPITYNREDVWLHDGILASNGCAHDQLVGLVSPLTV